MATRALFFVPPHCAATAHDASFDVEPFYVRETLADEPDVVVGPVEDRPP